MCLNNLSFYLSSSMSQRVTKFEQCIQCLEWGARSVDIELEMLGKDHQLLGVAYPLDLLPKRDLLRSYMIEIGLE